MKLVDIQRAAALRDERQTAISKHNYLSSVLRPHIQIGAYEFLDDWENIRPVLLAEHRKLIEKLEAELRNDFGIEVEPHFKTDADGWLKPTGELAEELTKRGYTLVGTGGNCKAWVRIMPDGEHIVVTDTNGGDEPTEADWIIGRYVGEEWVCEPGKGYSISSPSIMGFAFELDGVEMLTVADEAAASKDDEG